MITHGGPLDFSKTSLKDSDVLLQVSRSRNEVSSLELLSTVRPEAGVLLWPQGAWARVAKRPGRSSASAN